jgi:type IV fimbrial biogenesis protein FimT
MRLLLIVAGGKHRLVARRGFTVVELMVVVSILAVLLALAAPSFTPIVERWRVRQAVDSLRSTLYYARSEAIKRGGNVIVQKLPDNTNDCAASDDGDWHCGWVVVTSKGETLQRFDAPLNINVSRSGGEKIPFDRWGMTSGATGVGFALYPKDKTTNDLSARCLNVSSGGRIRIAPC